MIRHTTKGTMRNPNHLSRERWPRVKRPQQTMKELKIIFHGCSHLQRSTHARYQNQRSLTTHFKRFPNSFFLRVLSQRCLHFTQESSHLIKSPNATEVIFLWTGSWENKHATPRPNSKHRVWHCMTDIISWRQEVHDNGTNFGQFQRHTRNRVA